MFFDRLQQKRLDRFTEKVAPLGKKIYLWEINAAQREAVLYLLKKGYTVDAFISFNVYPDMRKAWGVNVFHPEFLNRPNKEDFILCISLCEYRLHKRYLFDHLCLSRIQIYVDYKIPSLSMEKITRLAVGLLNRIRVGYKRFTDRILGIKRKVKSLKRFASGCIVYRRLRRKFGNNALLLYFNYPGSGDAYLSGSLLKTYLEGHHLEDFAIVATGRVSKVILDCFGYHHITTISEVDSDCLRQFVNFVGAGRLNIKPMIKVANHLDISLRLAATRLSLLDIYVYQIFGYDNCPELQYPRFGGDSRQIDKLFRENCLRKGNTVILSPYANSEIGFSPLFWAKIVSYLKGMGLDTATMCHPPEVPLKYTTALDFPLSYATDILEYAGYFIGVRSGFCDVTIPAKCKKIILYPENIYGINHPFYRVPLSHINFRPIYEWASFQKMEIDAGAMEIRCNYHYTGHLEETIGKVLKKRS